MTGSHFGANRCINPFDSFVVGCPEKVKPS